MALGVVVPPAVLAWLQTQAVDGVVREVRATFGGFSHLTLFADLGHGPVVVKAASAVEKRADVSRDGRMLARLREVDLPVPSVVAATDDTDGWTVVVLSVIAGEGGLGVLQTSTEAELSARATVMARLMRLVHRSVPNPTSDPDLDLSVRSDRNRVALGSAGLPPDVRRMLDEALATPLLQRGVALVHGDFGFHNTLWSDKNEAARIVGLFDWEWSGWGNPLTDLAWLWWTLCFRRAPVTMMEAVLDEYGRDEVRAFGWSETCVHLLVCAQMAQIVLRTVIDSPQRAEWLRRIRGVAALAVPPI